MLDKLNAIVSKNGAHTSIALPDIAPEHVTGFKIQDHKLLVSLRGFPTIGQIIARENKDGRTYDTLWSGDHVVTECVAQDQLCASRRENGAWIVEVRV